MCECAWVCMCVYGFFSFSRRWNGGCYGIYSAVARTLPLNILTEPFHWPAAMMQDSLTPNLSWAPIETCPSAFPPLSSLLLCHSLSHTSPFLTFSLFSWSVGISPRSFPLLIFLSLLRSSLIHFFSLCFFPFWTPPNQPSSPRYVSVTSFSLIQSKTLAAKWCWQHVAVSSSAAQSFCPAVLQRISALCVSQCPISSVHMRCAILLGCLSMCQDYQVWQGGRQDWGAGGGGGGDSLYISVDVMSTFLYQHCIFCIFILSSQTELHIDVITAITPSSQLHHISHDDMYLTLERCATLWLQDVSYYMLRDWE